MKPIGPLPFAGPGTRPRSPRTHETRAPRTFDVPGHKRGRGNPELRDFLGEKMSRRRRQLHENARQPLSSRLRHQRRRDPGGRGVPRRTRFLHGRRHHLSRPAMVLTAVGRGDKIIMPRNVHRSAINALILCGAIPVYVNPQMDHTLGISLGMRVEEVEDAIRRHPDAKAVLVNNPTYYGICSNLKAIVASRTPWHDGPCGRSPRHPFLFPRRPAPLRHGRRRRHGRHQHAQIRRLPHAELHAFMRAGRQRRLRPPDHQHHADDQRLLPPDVQP